jgi:hypothetical protein
MQQVMKKVLVVIVIAVRKVKTIVRKVKTVVRIWRKVKSVTRNQTILAMGHPPLLHTASRSVMTLAKCHPPLIM